MTVPSPSTPDAQEPAADPAPQARIETLRAELAQTADATLQAVLQDEIGALFEHQLGDVGSAVRAYLAAYNANAGFRPPLYALIRIFERRRSFSNLLRLYQAEARSGASAAEQASAYVDAANVLEDVQGQADDARQLLEHALETDPSSGIAALMLESHARRHGDAELAHRALDARVAQPGDTVMQGMLLLDVAIGRQARGDVDGALAALEQAMQLPAGKWRFVGRLERMARHHGHIDTRIRATEELARLAEAVVAGEDPGHASGTFTVHRIHDRAHAGRMALAAWREAARLKLAHQADPEGALETLGYAVARAPDDAVLLQEHMLASELASFPADAAEDARLLLEHGPSGALAAPLHIRIAEDRYTQDDREGARRALEEALEADPASVVASGMLEDARVAEGAHEARVRQLEQTAGQGGAGAAVAWWQAAQIASDELGDFARARTLYGRALERAEADALDDTPVQRELLAAARRHGAVEAAREAATALLERTLEDEERSAVLREALDLTADPEAPQAEDADASWRPEAILARALEDPAAQGWAPDAARLHAASRGDGPLLARAHRALATRAPDADAATAHLCAAGRALARAGDAGDTDAAIATLREALDSHPGHPYAVGLLEELLRARGEADAVVELLRESATAGASQSQEASMLLAGAAAEAAGDTALAAQTYREAAEQDPTAAGPLWALRRLAQQNADVALFREALERLSEREIAAGEPSRATLELAEQDDFDPERRATAVTTLRSALEGSDVAVAAAVDLLTLPGEAVGPATRVEAVELLLEHAQAEDRVGLLRELGGIALSGGLDDPERASQTADAITEQAESDRWAAYARLVIRSADPEAAGERADAWVDLGRCSADTRRGAELVLHGLRAKVHALGDDAIDDAVLLGHEVAEASPESPAGVVALDETLSGGDDPEVRAQALAGRMSHSTDAGRAALEPAHARALLAADRAADAQSELDGVLERDPDDLASWDALRVAARETEDWDTVVRACDRLAAHARDGFRAQLLEEAGATLMDHLGRDAEARERLAAALDIDVTRDIAYSRLHELLAEREDTAGLLDIVTRRIAALDDPDQLTRLYYEQARLLRSEGKLHDALHALDQMLALSSEHAGALALASEIRVALEEYPQAVDLLRRLAEADVPTKQKRLARLGAADFLERHIGDPQGAIDELRAIETLGLADSDLYGRMANIAERASMRQDAITHLENAAEHAQGDTRAGYARRAAALRHELGDPEGAVRAYRHALDAVPTDLEAADGLAHLLSGADARGALADHFENAVHEHLLAHDPADPDGLRRLRRAATWRDDRARERMALGALVALDLHTDEERASYEADARAPSRPERELTERQLARLRASGDGGAAGYLAELAFEPLTRADELEPASFGVGRSDLVRPKQPDDLRDEVLAWAQALGVAPGEFYAGGDDPWRIAVAPGRRESIAWIVGTRIASPLNARARFRVAKLAMAVRQGTLPLIHRTPEDAATWLFACAAAAGTPLQAGEGRRDVDERARLLAKVMSRRTRRAIAEHVPSVPEGGAGLDAFCRAARRTAWRAGTLVSGELHSALSEALGTHPNRERVQESADARDLMQFWTSTTALALRHELGLPT